MRFAKNTQAASKGNLFVHCGGPGTVSDCLTVVGGLLSQTSATILNDYNLLAIDQVRANWFCCMTRLYDKNEC